MSTRAEQLGAWIANLELRDAPVPLIRKAQDHFLDTIGAAIAGEGRTPVQIAERVFNSPGVAPILVDAAPRACVDAARVNAIAAHAAEIDDTEGCDHTGAVVIPTLLALIAERQVSGDDVLTALIAGYETGRRVQLALGGYDDVNSVGWHSTAICGVFASAAAASRLLRLSPSQTASALGIAASASAGGWSFVQTGSFTKQLHVANATAAGLHSALLAQQGATGPVSIFEDVWGGFFNLYTTSSREPEMLIRDLGQQWHFAHSAIKMYAACRSAHAPIDAVVDELSRGLRPQDVSSIVIEVSSFLKAMICPDDPSSIEGARMSLPISLALLLLGRQLAPDDYTDYRSTDVRQKLATITVVENETLGTAQSVRLTLITPSGPRVLQRNTARGSEKFPFSAAEVEQKFRRLASPQLTPEGVEEVIRYVRSLDGGTPSFPDLSRFRSLSTAKNLPPAISRRSSENL